MNTAAMRRIDRAVGGPMCWALTVVRRVTDRVRRRAPERPRRILVVKLAEQGAWVVAHSALERAVELVGRDHVHLMTFDENRFVVDQLDLVPPANVISVRSDGFRSIAVDLLRAVAAARRLRVDAAVDLEFFARSSAILCFLSGASRRVGYHATGGEAAYRGDLMTHRLVYNPRLHVAEAFLTLVEALTIDADALPALDIGSPTPAPPPEVPISDAERRDVAASVAELVGAALPAEPRYVLLNANAGDLLPLRRWPEDRYVELARRLLAWSPDIVVLFTGSSAEARDTDRLRRKVGSPRAASLGGRTTMRELVALYGVAEVMVTNDSGPAHYAALAPIDVVTLFGPESPHVFGSLSKRNRAVWAALPCSPCVNAYNDRRSRCADNVCMQQIGVDQVTDIVVDCLTQRQRP